MIPVSQELWSTTPHTLVWKAAVTDDPNADVMVRHEATDLAPGEQYFPETWILTAAEWASLHETEYQLTINGVPIAEHDAEKALWRSLRRMANGNDSYTEANVRAAFGSALKLFRKMRKEITDNGS